MSALGYIPPGHGFSGACDMAGVLLAILRACPWALLIAALAFALGVCATALGHLLHESELGGPVFVRLKVPARR